LVAGFSSVFFGSKTLPWAIATHPRKACSTLRRSDGQLKMSRNDPGIHVFSHKIDLSLEFECVQAKSYFYFDKNNIYGFFGS